MLGSHWHTLLSEHISRKHVVVYTLPQEQLHKAPTKALGKSKTMGTSSARRARSRSAFRHTARPARSLPSAPAKPRGRKAGSSCEQASPEPGQPRKRRISAEEGEGPSTKRSEVIKSETEKEAPEASVAILMKWKEKQFKVDVPRHYTMGKVMKSMKKKHGVENAVFLHNRERVGEEEEVVKFADKDSEVEMVEERKN